MKRASMKHKDHWAKEGTTSHCISPSHIHLDDCQDLQLHKPGRLRTRLFTPQGPFYQALLDICTSRLTSAENSNFTWGLYLHEDYASGREFVAWKGGCCSGEVLESWDPNEGPSQMGHCQWVSVLGLGSARTEFILHSVPCDHTHFSSPNPFNFLSNFGCFFFPLNIFHVWCLFGGLPLLV